MFWRLAKPAGIDGVDGPPLTASAPVRVSSTAASITSAANAPLPFAVEVGLVDAYVGAAADTAGVPFAAA